MRKSLLLLCFIVISFGVHAQSTANYAFATNNTGSLALDMNSNSIDMSTGTTQLVAASTDDGASAVSNIGFDFFLMGNRFTQFSATSNGLIALGSTAATGAGSSSNFVPYQVAGGTTTSPKLGAFTADLYVSSTGKVHYKLIGTAPNRCLVIEFLNMALPYSTSLIGGTYQARLYETTGVIEYMYGAMSMNTDGGAFTAAFSIGFSVGTAVNTTASVTTATQSISYGATFNTNTYTVGALADLTSGSNGSRRFYRFTPIVPDPPTALNFTAVTASTMTPNWTDASNELKYALYRSDDGGNTYNFISLYAQNVVTAGAQTGLFPGTNFFWKLFSITEGGMSTALIGSQATVAGANISSNGTGGGNWSLAATWSGGVLPTSSDNVTIKNGDAVTIDQNATVNSLTVGEGLSGSLTFDGTSRTFISNTSITVAAGAGFTAGSNSVTHIINIGGTTATALGTGSLVVNGTFDCYIGVSAGKATVSFFGMQNAAVSGSGTINFNSNTVINKGTTAASASSTPPVLDIQRSYTVQGASTAGFIGTHTAGIVKFSGTYTLSNPVYAVAAYTIPLNGGLWLSNSNFTVAAQNGSPTVTGLLRVSNGTLNIGTLTGSSMGFSSGSTIIVEGGAINSVGRFGVAAAANIVYYNQSGGTLTLNTIGHASTTLASFDLGTGASTVIVSGGTVNLVQACTGASGPRDYRGPTTVVPTFTSGTLNIGTTTTATNFTFRIQGQIPANIVVDNTTNNKILQATAAPTIYGTLTINTGSTYDCNALATNTLKDVTNNGLIIGSATGSRFYFSGTATQVYTGTGVLGTNASPLDGVGTSNYSNTTLNAPVVALRVNLFGGTFIHSNQITLGNGGTSTAIVQRGGGSAAGGSFDIAPTFNPGTGGVSLIYSQATTNTTTSFEVPVSRSVTALTSLSTNGITLAGGNIDVSGTLTMTAGIITTSASNVLGLGAAGTLSGTPTNTNMIVGPFNKSYPASRNASGTYSNTTVLPVGKGSVYYPIFIDPTTTAGGTVTFKGEAFTSNGGTAGAGAVSLSTNRFEAIVTNGAANLTSAFVRLSDASVTATNKILQASTAAGAYASITSTTTFATGILTTATAIAAAAYNGYFAYGDVVACVAPTAQPTVLVLNATGQTTVAGSFTAASPAPTNYLVVRTTSNSLAGLPVDATSYTVGTNTYFGTGGYVESVGAGTTVSSTGLTSGTTYYYWVFSFNTGNCSGGPTYFTAAPLNGSVVTGILFTSITSGNWEDATTWNQGALVPNSSSDVAIAATHTVTVNSVTASAGALTVNANGILTVSGSSLSVSSALTNNGTVNASAGTINVTAAATTGITNAATTSVFNLSGSIVNVGITNNTFCNRTFTNNGTLTVSSGTLNVYGNIASALGSTFNQSGGNINIDGNAGGNAANSVASGTALLQFKQLNSGINLTGGTLTIVDPHANATASNSIGYDVGTAGTQTSLSAHTTRFGDGVSTDAGGNAIGFNIDNWTTTGYLALGSIIVNGPTGTNRGFTSTYQFTAQGDITVNNGGILNTASTIFGGNLTINTGGTFNSSTTAVAGKLASNTSSALTFGNATVAQTITNNGTIRNSATTPTANFAAFQVFNSNAAGVAFGTGIQSPTFSGAITVSTGTVTANGFTLQGTSAQAVTLTAATSIINVANFTLNNSTGSTLSGLGKLNVTNTANLTAGTLTTGGLLVLKSSASGTARIPAITGAITGTVTTETYIPGGRRAFRFLGHPFSTTLNMGALVDNIYITGAGAGFDATQSSNPSAFWFDNTATAPGAWTAFTSTADNSWTQYRGIRVLVRGDRTQAGTLTGSTVAPNPVTLDVTGTLNTGAANISLPTAGAYQFVGNPYPSPTDIGTVIDATANIGTQYWVWDANAVTRGAYVTRTVGSGAYNLAMNGAFFVQPTTATTLAFTEANKAATAVNLFRTNNSSKFLQLEVQYNNYYADNMFVSFDKDAKATLDARDGEKMINQDVNLYALSADSRKLGLDARPLVDGTVIPLGFTTTIPSTYKVRVADYGLDASVEIYLKDKLLNTMTKLAAGTEYSFDVVAGNTASQGDGRFELVQKLMPVLPTLTPSFTVALSPNPAKDMVKVTFTNVAQVNTTIAITNAEGKTVKTVDAGNVQSGQVSISLKGIAKGNYFVTLSNGTERKTEKLIIIE